MTKAQGLNPIQSTEATRRAAAGLGPSTESAPRATTFRKTNKPYPVLAVRVRDGIRTGAVADARARTEPPGGGGGDRQRDSGKHATYQPGEPTKDLDSLSQGTYWTFPKSRHCLPIQD